MTGLWPEDWRAELAKAFEPAESGPTIEVVFIGPDGQPVGEPIVILRGEGPSVRRSLGVRIDESK
jgi:hypothetical protein